MKYNISYRCVSHTGRVRKMNQDNFICCDHYMKTPAKGAADPVSGSVSSGDKTLFAVFDGMGGEECGEVASLLAAQCATETSLGRKPVEDLSMLCLSANARICDYVREHGLSSMGTTAAMLAFTRREITLCNIGDSRIFRFSRGKLEQISTDHVCFAPFRVKPLLSQNLGIPPEEMIIAPYFSRTAYRSGDRYLICSDGLTDMVSNEEIVSILKNNPLEDATDALLNRALHNGGRDNITIILLDIHRAPIWSF